MDKDQIAQQFAQALQKAQAQMVEDILDLKQSLTRDEFISLISTLDVDDYIFNQIGMQNDLNKYIASYESVLLGMEATGQVTEETLQALVRLDEATFREQINLIGQKAIDEAVKGIIGGKTEREIAQSMIDVGLKQYEAETLANTALNTFERNVTSQMTAFDPEDATYVYQGPIDDKTRDICLKMMASGSMTKEEIRSQYPGAFVDGGGFGCRHRWARETSVSRKLTDPDEAQRFIQTKAEERRAKGLSPRPEPLTPQQKLDV